MAAEAKQDLPVGPLPHPQDGSDDIRIDRPRSSASGEGSRSQGDFIPAVKPARDERLEVRQALRQLPHLLPLPSGRRVAQRSTSNSPLSERIPAGPSNAKASLGSAPSQTSRPSVRTCSSLPWMKAASERRAPIRIR